MQKKKTILRRTVGGFDACLIVCLISITNKRIRLLGSLKGIVVFEPFWSEKGLVLSSSLRSGMDFWRYVYRTSCPCINIDIYEQMSVIGITKIHSKFLW